LFVAIFDQSALDRSGAQRETGIYRARIEHCIHAGNKDIIHDNKDIAIALIAQ
jgi:hypothetical protein